MDNLQLIHRSILFREFDYCEFAQILPSFKGRFRTVKKDTILLNEGDFVSQVGIIAEGSLGAIKTQADGNISILDFLFPSKVFALDMALTHSKISALSIHSLEDSTIFTFPFDGISTFDWMNSSQKSRMSENLLIYLANENVRKLHKIEIISQHSLRKRILSYLDLMSRQFNADNFVIPYSREQLANYLCVNRSTLSRELSNLKSDGIIDFEKNRFHIFKD